MRKIWDKIVALISKVPYDKLLHFIVGLVAAAFFAIVWPSAAEWCIAPVIAIAFAKEFFDNWTGDKCDWLDFVATVAGGLVIWIFTLIG